MNKVYLPLLSIIFLMTGVSFAQTPPPSEPVVSAPGVTVVHHAHDHHPEIHRAMRKLRGAKADLEKAAHDYGGHKATALTDIDQALQELQAALNYEDNK